MPIDITVKVQLVESGHFHFEEPLGPQPIAQPIPGSMPADNVKRDQVVPLTSSIVAPGLARLIAR